MALTTTELQAQIDALNRAIGSGARSVTLGGQTITYNTAASLIQARNDLQVQLSTLVAQETKARRPKQSFLYQSGRGY